MSERQRFWLISGFLLLAVAVSVGVRIDRIERDLLARTQEALGSAGIAFYGVDFAGRDALLHGLVASPERAEQIETLVAAVPGVRTVARFLTIERLPEPEISAPVAMPVLRLQRLGDLLFLAGRLPDDASRQALVAAAEKHFGKANVTTGLRTSSAVTRAAWVDRSTALVDIMAKLQGNGRLSIHGDTGLLFGQLRDHAAASEIRALTDTVGPLHWRLDLVALDATEIRAGGGP